MMIYLSDTLNKTMAAGDVATLTCGCASGRRWKNEAGLPRGEGRRRENTPDIFFCRLIGAQANARSTGPTSQLQGAARTPALLQVIARTGLWRPGYYTYDFKDSNHHQDSYASSVQ